MNGGGECFVVQGVWRGNVIHRYHMDGAPVRPPKMHEAALVSAWGAWQKGGPWVIWISTTAFAPSPSLFAPARERREGWQRVPDSTHTCPFPWARSQKRSEGRQSTAATGSSPGNSKHNQTFYNVRLLKPN